MNNKSPERNIHNSSVDTVESIIWDELKLFLDNDEDFKIEKIGRNNIP